MVRGRTTLYLVTCITLNVVPEPCPWRPEQRRWSHNIVLCQLYHLERGRTTLYMVTAIPLNVVPQPCPLFQNLVRGRTTL
jgi:hypothetical protein